MNENTPTPEEAGASVSNDTKFQCKINEKSPHTQSEALNSLMAFVNNPTEPEIDKSIIGMLRIKEANVWREEAASRPDPKALWMSLWYEGEVCCLFADSNLGKSIYAVQIADHIAKTEPVLYFDFELSDKQFQLRYTDDNGMSHIFPANLHRAEIDPDAYGDTISDGSFEDIIIEDIENAAIQFNTRTIIIDNITWICTTSEKGDSAGNLMIRLMGLKKKYGWSILVLAHTPKRSLLSPITQNDLAGSKKLFNFFDSVFAIGQSAKDENLRYIKQIKVRYGAFEYGAENVIVCDISKDNAFLKFNQVGFAKEREHLKEASEKDESDIKDKILELHHQNKSYRDIAKEIGGISPAKVCRVIKSISK